MPVFVIALAVRSVAFVIAIPVAFAIALQFSKRRVDCVQDVDQMNQLFGRFAADLEFDRQAMSPRQEGFQPCRAGPIPVISTRPAVDNLLSAVRDSRRGGVRLFGIRRRGFGFAIATRKPFCFNGEAVAVGRRHVLDFGALLEARRGRQRSRPAPAPGAGRPAG